MGRPAHTTCLRGRRERKRSSLARFDCRRKREHGSQFVHILNLFSSVTLLKPTVTAAMLARQNWHLCLFFCLCASTQGEPWPIPCTPPRRSSAVWRLSQQAAQLSRPKLLSYLLPAAYNRIYPILGWSRTTKLPNRLYHELTGLLCAWCAIWGLQWGEECLKRPCEGWHWPNPALYKIRRCL